MPDPHAPAPEAATSAPKAADRTGPAPTHTCPAPDSSGPSRQASELHHRMKPPPLPGAHRVVVLALDGVYPFELGIPHRVFGSADGRYEVVTVTVDGGPVHTDADFTVHPGSTRPAALELARADTVVIPPYAIARTAARPDPATAAALAAILPGTRIASICTGAFLLAAAGLLRGRRATTHWQLAGHFRELFPQVELDPGVLFIDDGEVLTSAGAASGVDVCLHLIRRDHGIEVAGQVARRCVVPPYRDGGQAQYIERPVPPASDTGTGPTRDWALQRLHLPLTLDEMAVHAAMSTRTFARRFRDETGLSPGRWLTQQRLRRARHLLESSDLPVDRIAHEVGFATATSLRRHLTAEAGVAPSAYRRTFRATATPGGAAPAPTRAAAPQPAP